MKYATPTSSAQDTMTKVKVFKNRSNFNVKVTRSTRHVFVKHGWKCLVTGNVHMKFESLTSSG